TRSLGRAPEQMVAGHFNEAPFPELVVTLSDWSVAVLLGRGDGTFAPASQIATRVHPAQPIQVADFNGDGHEDLLFLDVDRRTVRVVLGRRDGSVNTVPPADVGSECERLPVADVVGDS